MSAVQDYTIYVLKCISDKYYVGKTYKDISERFAEHLTGEGSLWTKKYTPLVVLETKTGDKYEEDATLFRMMEKYGLNNVRGGTYCKIELTNDEINEITKRMVASSDRCYKCKLPGHFGDKCPQGVSALQDRYSHKQQSTAPSQPSASATVHKDKKSQYLFLSNSGAVLRRGPQQSTAPSQPSTSATVHEDINTDYLYVGNGATVCKGGPLSSRKSHSSRNHVKTDSQPTCFRCGRKGHYSPQCFATNHISGNPCK